MTPFWLIIPSVDGLDPRLDNVCSPHPVSAARGIFHTCTAARTHYTLHAPYAVPYSAHRHFMGTPPTRTAARSLSVPVPAVAVGGSYLPLHVYTPLRTPLCRTTPFPAIRCIPRTACPVYLDVYPCRTLSSAYWRGLQYSPRRRTAACGLCVYAFAVPPLFILPHTSYPRVTVPHCVFWTRSNACAAAFWTPAAFASRAHHLTPRLHLAVAHGSTQPL